MEEYSVSESDGIVTVGVLVLEGSLGTNITIELSTVNGSALCESHYVVHYRALIQFVLTQPFNVFVRLAHAHFINMCTCSAWLQILMYFHALQHLMTSVKEPA